MRARLPCGRARFVSERFCFWWNRKAAFGRLDVISLSPRGEGAFDRAASDNKLEILLLFHLQPAHPSIFQLELTGRHDLDLWPEVRPDPTAHQNVAPLQFRRTIEPRTLPYGRFPYDAKGASLRSPLVRRGALPARQLKNCQPAALACPLNTPAHQLKREPIATELSGPIRRTDLVSRVRPKPETGISGAPLACQQLSDARVAARECRRANMSQFDQAALNPDLLVAFADEEMRKHAFVAIDPRSGEDERHAPPTNQTAKSRFSVSCRRPRLPFDTAIRRARSEHADQSRLDAVIETNRVTIDNGCDSPCGTRLERARQRGSRLGNSRRRRDDGNKDRSSDRGHPPWER